MNKRQAPITPTKRLDLGRRRHEHDRDQEQKSKSDSNSVDTDAQGASITPISSTTSKAAQILVQASGQCLIRVTEGQFAHAQPAVVDGHQVEVLLEFSRGKKDVSDQ